MIWIKRDWENWKLSSVVCQLQLEYKPPMSYAYEKFCIYKSHSRLLCAWKIVSCIVIYAHNSYVATQQNCMWIAWSQLLASELKPYMSNINHKNHIHAAWYSKLIICDHMWYDILQLYSMSLALKLSQACKQSHVYINY